MKIIWFSEIKWTYLTTRKQQIIRRFPADWEILFIESFVFGRENTLWPARDGRVTYATVPFFKATPYPLINRLQSFFLVRMLMAFMAAIWVRILCRITGFQGRDRVICTSNIYYADVIRKMKKRLTLYDCNDYPLGFSVTLPFAPVYFEKTIRLSDVTITVSKKLLADIRPYKSDHIFVIGNGVDYDLFSRDQTLIPDEMKTIPSPIVFFSGALADWLDTELIRRVATEAPDISVVLLGPVKTAETQMALDDLTQLPNVHWIGEKKHDLLPGYIRSAAVCMLPFKMNRRLLGANPNTLYEFLACGKPVVTLDYSDEIRQLSPHVLVAHTSDEFVDCIRTALLRPPDAERLRRIARENSWPNKSEAFVKLITDHLHEKK